MRCSACGGENSDGKRFCGDCGESLALVCAACGAQLESGRRYCGDCGSPVGALGLIASSAAPAAIVPTAQQAQNANAPTTELRHVSVLFCDLVGFTPFSEKRDAEEVREVLSGYFELARAIVGRYGGVVEKFIGDAVMAVWGAPVAKEDDAERAVRAGLELVSAVAAYGVEHRSHLQARVGIVTGSAATTETAEEGLVIGDRVNTAARIQSAAPPGCCYVDETTRSATAAAIAYVDAGEHELKGKSEPVRLYRATRVVATVAGSERSGVIEAPFIGRDHELRLVKELFHASADRHSARMVLVSGVAGVGKSRLAWEFFKYIDGLAGAVLWHSGRCLSYGEGVSYWALSEMVRARLQIGEEDPQDVVAERLRAGLERWIEDLADREFIAPRLGQLLGLSTLKSLAREELFSGWRLFFERLAEHLPVVMVIEDLQWADAGMVEFLDHLLEWSGDHAIFLLVLSRPEGTDRRGLVLSRRSVTTLPLDPLSDEVMGEVLDGLVTGLPLTARARIVERAEGIPLYAIETVRGLLDKGVIEKGDDGLLHLVGDLGELEITPGLTALIASRLDALGPDERRLVKECSVLGGSFPRQAVEAVSDIDPGELGELLSSLVRKEVLTVRADRFSPERGQYAFTQSLIRSVAYDMLTRSERKARHLRTAEHLRTVFPDDGAEVAEVIAAHLHDGYRAAGDDADADELRARAAAAYRAAGERAASVGAPDAAEVAYTTALELSTEEAERAQLAEEAGRMAILGGFNDRAASHLEASIAAHTAAGRVSDAARVTVPLADAMYNLGRIEEAIDLIRKTLSSAGSDTLPPAVAAELQAYAGTALAFIGQPEEASVRLDEALVLSQQHEIAKPLAVALNFKAYLLGREGRVEEARLLLEGSLAVAKRHALEFEATAENNLAWFLFTHDLLGAEEHLHAALGLARRLGARPQETVFADSLMDLLIILGRFDEAEELGTDVLGSSDFSNSGTPWLHLRLGYLAALRGRLESARQHFAHFEQPAESAPLQAKVGHGYAMSVLAFAEGDFRAALDEAQRVLTTSGSSEGTEWLVALRECLPIAIDAALALQEIEEAEELVKLLAARPPGTIPAFLSAHLHRARALVDAARGATGNVETGLEAAEKGFRDLNYPYWTARVQLHLAEWLAGQGRREESARIATEAAAAFETLGTPPMLAKARALLEPEMVSKPGADAERAVAQGRQSLSG